MEAIHIRSVKTTDLELLHGLYQSVYSASDSMSESFNEKYSNFASFEHAFTSLRSTPGHIALLAELELEPVAFLTVRPRAPMKLRHTADLSMGVGAMARGKGVGNLILQEALRLAETQRILEIVYLMVRADNDAAVGLYEKVGFERLATLPKDTKIGSEYFDGMLMRYAISTS
jgi:ribosomal protein S18 acetylase RimI-like enzyme